MTAKKPTKPVETHGGEFDLQADLLEILGPVQGGVVYAAIAAKHPELTNTEACFNCGRSMKITGYVADLHNALLLLGMARAVRKNLDEGMSFTEANKVHFPSLQLPDAVKKRQTQCDYLRLIKQPDALRRTGYWVITDLGWAALRGDRIPRVAYYWNGKLIRRSEETTTLAEMFRTHLDLVAVAADQKRKVRDHTAAIADYDPGEWSQFGGVTPGRLFAQPQACREQLRALTGSGPVVADCERPKDHQGKHEGRYIGFDAHPRVIRWDEDGFAPA